MPPSTRIAPLEDRTSPPVKKMPQTSVGAFPLIVMFPEVEETLEVSSKYVPHQASAFPVSVMFPALVNTEPVVKYKPPEVLDTVPAVIETDPPVDCT